jgi:DNA repair photolyase
MEKEFKSFLKTVGGNEGDKCHYPTRLDLYGCGCYHDCSYCYAKSLLEFRKLWNPSNPSSANFQKVARAIRRNFKLGDIVRLGGMTDCFQPIEGKRKLTYNAIKELNTNGVGYLIVTKSSLVASDEYMAIMDKNLAHIQISLTTTDDKFCRTYEQATPPSERIRAIEKLHKAGFDVQLRLSPFIPDFIDFDILNNVQCDKILVEFLRVNTWIKKWFDIDYSDYTYKQSGYNHLPLELKIEHLKKIKNFKEITVCEDVTEHYDYWKRNVNHNPEDCCNLRK